MICGDCSELISEYLDGELRGAARTEFEGHLATCTDCARALRGVRAVRTRLGSLPRHELPDSFGFRIRRMLVEESEREQSWLVRVREAVMPAPQTAWAAATGVVAALASFTLLWSVWSPTGSAIHPATIAERAPDNAQAVRYVLDRLPSGDLIESTASADTVRRTVRTASAVSARTVSADF